MTGFTEDDVYEYLYMVGLDAVIDDAEVSLDAALPKPHEDITEYDTPEFELWKLLKRKAVEKIRDLHRLAQYGTFIGTKINLPIDKTKPMALDLLGTHEDGLFILELKIAKAAERNAFTELFAYSNYIAGLFPRVGAKYTQYFSCAHSCQDNQAGLSLRSSNLGPKRHSISTEFP